MNSFPSSSAPKSPSPAHDVRVSSSQRKSLPLLRQIGRVVLASFVLIVSCSPPIKQPVGAAREYTDAEDLFKMGNLDKALDYTDDLATASPATSYTDRARVMRVMIYGSRVKAYKELAEAYAKGIDKTKNPRFKAEYEHLRSDSLQFAAKAALGLAETAHEMLAGPGIGKEEILEVPYPSTEGPETISQLTPMLEGGWIEPADQEAANLAARHKAIDDELALAVGGDRAKARAALAAGPVEIPGADFGLFLGKELLTAAGIFDHKHYGDFQKFTLITGQADAAAQAVLDLLKAAPDKDKEKAAKKLQADIKDAIKKNS